MLSWQSPVATTSRTPTVHKKNPVINERSPVVSGRSPSTSDSHYAPVKSPVSDALRLTVKGQLKYDPHWYEEGRINEILEACTSSPPITAPLGLDLSSLTISPTNQNDNDDNDVIISQKSVSNQKPRTASGDTIRCDAPPTSPTKTPPTRARSFVTSSINLRIFHDELNYNNQEFNKKVKTSIENKLEQKMREWERIQQRADEQSRELELREASILEQRARLMDDQDRQAKAELEIVQARQREEHSRYRKALDAKYREAKARKQEMIPREREMEEKRKQELQRQLEELAKYSGVIEDLQKQAVSDVTECPYKHHLPDMATKGLELLTVIHNQAMTLLSKARTEGPEQEDYTSKFTDLVDNANNAFKFIQAALEYARKSGIEEETKQKEVEKFVAENTQRAGATLILGPAGEPAGDGSVLCVAIEAFQEYSERLKILEKILDAAKPLTDAQDSQLKQYKNDLMKVVSTPVNAISSRSGVDLKDKLRRLHNVLEGDQVQVGSRRVTVAWNKAALPFVKNMLAYKLVSQGDETVSSNHEAAFPIAAIALGVWCVVPDFGILLLAHLHKVCPYTVPYYIPQADGQSMEDYYRCLGYKYKDGKPEQQDSFLKRMSGYVRLYAAIIVTDMPPGAMMLHPHTLSHAWQWISRLVNLPPRPDITATLLYDMLQVTGHYLYKSFTKQFHKLLNLILTEFLPKIRDVTADGRMGPVTRLEIYLEKWLKEKQIPSSEGVVSTSFWFTKDDSADYYHY